MKMMDAILLNQCEKCGEILVSTQDKPSFCNNTECEYYDLTIVDTPICFANKGDSEENMEADLLADKTLNDFIELKGLISLLGVSGADCDQEDDINRLFDSVESGLKQITNK